MMKSTNAQKVKHWMSEAGQLNGLDSSTHHAPDVMDLQCSFIDEEYNELVQAYANGRRDEIIKEAVDLIWVSYGLLHLLGIDADEAFGRVYASNQTKIPFEYINGKVQKGKNYQPPSFSDL